MAVRVAGLYQVTKRLGIGSHGSVFQAKHLLTGSEVAVKVERIPKNDRTPQVLPYEAQIYKQIGSAVGFPSLHLSGSEGDVHFLVLDMLGATLEHLKRFCCGKFSLKTTLLLADQMLSRVEYVHSRGLICRDMKPDNFAMGCGIRSSIVHFFDFGLAKLYLNPRTGEHIPFREERDGLGTPRYASSNVHFGREQSRKDDIEALGILLVYLFGGSLPWQGIFAPSIEAKLLRIGEMKIGDPMRKALADCPPEFGLYFEHCRSLGFEDRPDYGYLRHLFRSLMEREGWTYDAKFDWTPDEMPPLGRIYPAEKYLL